MNRSEDNDALTTLLKETFDGLGRLMTGHLHLARLELLSELKTLGRQFAVATLAITFVLLGYAIGCLGLAVFISRWLGLSNALFLLGGLHLFGGITALLFIQRERKLAHLMQESKLEAHKSASMLTDSIHKGTGPNAAPSNFRASSPPSLALNTSGKARIAKTPN